jgi:hypothetical protein
LATDEESSLADAVRFDRVLRKEAASFLIGSFVGTGGALVGEAFDRVERLGEVMFNWPIVGLGRQRRLPVKVFYDKHLHFDKQHDHTVRESFKHISFVTNKHQHKQR